MLQLSNVRLFHPDDPPFDHTLRSGCIHVVLGPNQAGKTNLCRLIAGLPCAASGHVELDAEPLVEPRHRRRAAAMVYQAFVNYPNLTVAQNIASPLKAQKVARQDIDQEVHTLATILGLEELLGRMPDELSGGQQQRLAIARALAKRARILLLDEPLVNLDFKLREALQRELRALLKDRAVTVLYTSTDPRDAFALADELLLLQQGSKVQSGTLESVYSQPANPTAMALLCDAPLNRMTWNDHTVYVRPEHVHLGAPTEQQIGLSMSVQGHVTNGNVTYIQGRVEDEDWVLRHPGVWHQPDTDSLRLHVTKSDLIQF